MRIERRGGAPDLEQALQDFVLNGFKGRALDDNKNQEAVLGGFPDFSCMRGLLLIEMKHLETEQDERINEVFENKIDPKERPVFYGKRDSRLVLKNVSNADDILRVIAIKLAGTLETHLRKANRQFEDYRFRNPRKNSVSICIILNSLVREFNPETVRWALQFKMNGPEVRFPHIDAIVYISEKHGNVLPDGRIAHAIMSYANASMHREVWKEDIVNALIEKWVLWRSGSMYVAGGDSAQFDNIEDIPERMARSENWDLQYNRHPYLSDLPEEKLKILFLRCNLKNALGIMKGSWKKPTMDEMKAHIQEWTHINAEINRRGIDLNDFSVRKLSAQEREEVISGFPNELIHMMPNLHVNAID